MAGETRQAVTLHAETHGERLRSALAGLDSALENGEIGAPDSAGMFDIELPVATREQALVAVREAIAAAGVDDHFTFPETTGTHYLRPSQR